METKRLEVTAEGKKVYDIVIENNFNQLVKELSVFGIKERKLCIVTERQVASYYLEEVCSLLEKECAKLEVYIFQAGEERKNLSTVDSLYHFLITHEFDRKDMLLALGGGVTGDLTGFAAATYLRGIDFVQIPTSLLAQVDSSIGGKSGVDYHAYKNMVGAFYMPKLVYINVNTVKTLSERQYHSGLGEVIKHGLIRNKAYFEWMKDNKEAVAKREDEALAYMIEGSCEIKREVVEEDPKEHGVRALLNFGHTLGHSIEKLMNFSLAHGECVAVGSLLAADISCQRGYISEEENKEIKTDLIVARKMAEKSNCSYIFGESSRDIFCREYKNGFQQFSVIISSLSEFALKDLFVIRNTHSGVISANFVLPMAFRIENDNMGAKGDFTVSLTEPILVDEERKNLLETIVEQISIVLYTIIQGLQVTIKNYGKQSLNDGEEGWKLELMSKREGMKEIPIRMESEGIIKIISILNALIQAFGNPSICLVIDELDSGIFEYMLGELLDSKRAQKDN